MLARCVLARAYAPGCREFLLQDLPPAKANSRSIAGAAGGQLEPRPLTSLNDPGSKSTPALAGKANEYTVLGGEMRADLELLLIR